MHYKFIFISFSFVRDIYIFVGVCMESSIGLGIRAALINSINLETFFKYIQATLAAE